MFGPRILSAISLGAGLLIDIALAHPGEHHSSVEIERQVAKNHLIARDGSHKLARCADSVQARAVQDRAIKRRSAKVETLRGRKKKRDSTEIQALDNVSHNYTGSVSNTSSIFNSNTSCILEPQMTIGPYWVSGELIRQDDREDQEGVDLELELQFIDTNTCEPISGLYIDKWHANSTGVYAGIKESSLNSTYLRAIQVTDDDGVVTFDTLVPGHYQGRATHTHIMVHQNVTKYANNTYSGGTVRSIGQLFYETTLRDAVEKVEPYASNTNEVTTNEEDSLLLATTLGEYDPFVNYIYLGDSISDGIFAWHSIGIDISANYTDNESAASAYYATGGVDESGSSNLGGSGGGSINGTGMQGNGTGPPSGGSGGPSGSRPMSIVSGTTSPTGTTSLAASQTPSTGSASTIVANSGASSSKITVLKSIIKSDPPPKIAGQAGPSNAVRPHVGEPNGHGGHHALPSGAPTGLVNAGPLESKGRGATPTDMARFTSARPPQQ